MKILIIYLIFGVFVNSCFGQDDSSNYQTIIGKTRFIHVYKFLRKTIKCGDSKNERIGDGSDISECFFLKKKLNPLFTKRIVDILLNQNSFTKANENCFTTDYGMILFDEKNKIIGAITMSSNCNNIGFNYIKIKTLTDKANNKILKIIR